MSIFGKIKDAIFGGRGPLSGNYVGKDERPAAPPQPVPAPSVEAGAPAMPQMGEPASIPQPTVAAAPTTPVDVEAVLTEKAKTKGGDLDWRSSIVDLMKLLDLDSSLDNRKELATELGYSGAKDGSAEMNIWLHKAVMKQLAEHGGTVPAELKD